MAGDRVEMHLRDLDLKPGARVELTIRAVDAAGNVGPPSEARVQVSDQAPAPLPTPVEIPAQAAKPLPRLGPIEVAIIDELDKVHPDSGAMIPAQPEGYLSKNHLWDATTRRIALHAARNEFVAFQVLLRGGSAGERDRVRPSLTFDARGGPPPRVEFGRYRDVPSRSGPMPDPIVPLDLHDEPTPGALHVEIYVPHNLDAGDYPGTLTLSDEDGAEALRLPLTLTVRDFTLPDHLSFIPEMNCYGLPDNERDYYRMAHRHRTVINRLPYHQGGQIAEGCARAGIRSGRPSTGPNGTVASARWWTARHSPICRAEGSRWMSSTCRCTRTGRARWRGITTAATGRIKRSRSRTVGRSWQRRRGSPTTSPGRDGMTPCSSVCSTTRWTSRRKGWSRGSSPWLLDEPASFQDYWALRYFARAFHEGINQSGISPRARLVFRADISRPQWRRDSLDGLLDYHVVGGAVRKYPRLVFERKRTLGEIVLEYGSTNPVEGSNLQAAGWCLDAWALGTDGVIPWQTIGNADSWKKADELSLFYPMPDGGAGVIPSIRLKAYRRGEQDVEYLTLWARLKDEPRWAIGRRVREALKLSGERHGTGIAAAEDAGRIDYARLRPQDLWALRMRIGAALSEAHPTPSNRLIEFRTPPRDPERIAPGDVSSVSTRKTP